MENTGVLDTADYGGATKEIRLTNESLGYLKETAKWGTFLAIMGFVFVGFMILIGLGLAFFMSSMSVPGMDEAMGGMGGFMGIFYVVIALIYVYPIYQLFLFSKKCKLSIAGSSTDLMTEALGHLKSLYKFMGILMVIILGFYVLMFVFGGIGAMFM